MANFFVNAAWAAIKPLIRQWLATRALVLPTSDKVKLTAAIAKITHCDTVTAAAAVAQAQDAFTASALAQFDAFRP